MIDKVMMAIMELNAGHIDQPENFDSLIINRRKPFTYRAFWYPQNQSLKGLRVCLHKFDPCEESDAFLHPHPWPSAMAVLEGHYRMKVGASVDKGSQPIIVSDILLGPGSAYSMPDPMGWHSVQPMETCYSIMVNGKPWGDEAHSAAPTTKGKDLDKMTPEQLADHLATFKRLLSIVDWVPRYE